MCGLSIQRLVIPDSMRGFVDLTGGKSKRRKLKEERRIEKKEQGEPLSAGFCAYTHTKLYNVAGSLHSPTKRGNFLSNSEHHVM